jgi:hypothetical protein
MLECNLNGAILEVKESLLGWTDTKVSFWYYDVENWTRSLTGKRDEAPSEPMRPDEIDWAKKHYLPKALALKSAPVKSLFDPNANVRYAKVTASMEADGFYDGHTREECAAEWRRRYDELAMAG